MAGFESIMPHAVPFTLVTFRLLGLFLAAPALSSTVVPARYKSFLALMMAAAIYPSVTLRIDPLVAPSGDLDLLSLVPMVLLESCLGFVVGIVASTPLMALEMSGVMMGHQMGLGLARAYNPEADYDADVLGQLLFYIAAGVFFAVGGLEQLWRGVMDSFATVPVAGFHAHETPVKLLVGVLGASFDLALRVSAPVSGIILLLVIVFGAIGKTIPQVNIMSVGFTVKILAGVGVAAASVYAVRAACGDTIEETLRQVGVWIRQVH